MTLVSIDLRHPSAGGEDAPHQGRIGFKPSKRRRVETGEDDYFVLPAPFFVQLVGGFAVVDLTPTGASWFWEITEELRGNVSLKRTVAVPDSESVDYGDLVDIDPSTYEPDLTEDQLAGWDTALTQAVLYRNQANDAATDALSATDQANTYKVAAEAAQSLSVAAKTASESARDSAVAARNVAQLAASTALTTKSETLTLRDQTEDLRDETQLTLTNASNLRDGIAADKDNSETSRLAAEVARNAAVDARTGAELARTAADTHLDTALADAVAARDVASAQRALAQTAKTDAETARTGAQTARTGAETARDVALSQTFAGVALGAADLNTITTAGMYYQSAVGNSTALNNYPIVNYRGILEVLRDGSIIIQRFTPTNGGSNSARVIYMRRFDGTTWQSWSSFSLSRTDQSAGRVVYTWDPVNGREQLTWGDTGYRDITSLMVSDTSTPAVDVASGSVRLRRYGSTVTIAFVNTIFNNTSASLGRNFPTLIPAGFRASGTARIGLPVGPNVAGILTTYVNTGQTSIVTGTTGAMFNEVSWSTNDAWPTTLPGTSVASIPNL